MFRERSQKLSNKGWRVNTSVVTYNQKSVVPEGRLENSGMTAHKWPVPGAPAASTLQAQARGSTVTFRRGAEWDSNRDLEGLFFLATR